jgi:hypothetical protein
VALNLKNEAQDQAERTQIFQTDGVFLWYYPTLKIIHHQMIRMPSSETFRTLLASGAQLVERHGASKWLSDDRGNTVLRDHDLGWAEGEWLTRVLRSGFKYWAIVPPASAVGTLAMHRLATENIERGLLTFIAESPAAALGWLKAR